MLVPETFLTAEAHARSQAAGLSLQIAGHGLSVDGSRETSGSLSQQVSQRYCRGCVSILTIGINVGVLVLLFVHGAV